MKITLTMSDCTLEEAQALLSFNRTPAPYFVEDEVLDLDDSKETENSEFDSNGDVWNPNIHSSTKIKTAQGVWKKKRGAIIMPEPPVSMTPPVPEPPISITPPSPPESVVELTLPEIVNRITQALTNGEKTIADVNHTLSELGLHNIGELGARADLFDLFMLRFLQ